jgi:hypothetical protein
LGIETMEELRFVAEARAAYAQGYLFSPAVSLEELAVLLAPGRLGRTAPNIVAACQAAAAPPERLIDPASFRSRRRRAGGVLRCTRLNHPG